MRLSAGGTGVLGYPDNADNSNRKVSKAREPFRATFTGLQLIERPVEYCFVQHSTSQFLLIRWTEHGQNLLRKGRRWLEHRTHLRAC